MKDYFNNFKKYAFRLELLQKYSVNEEKEDFENFNKKGKVNPKINEEWHDILIAAKKRGAKVIRAHVIKEPLSDYIKFELEHYKENKKYGEGALLISKEEFDKLNINIKRDFWLFDDNIVLEMNYDSDGHFLGFSQSKDIQKYLDFKKMCEKADMSVKKK